MENVETISLDLFRSKEKWFTTKIFAQMKKVFAKMKNLRFLKVYSSHGDEYKMLLPKGFEFPPNLNYLHWDGLESLPSNFHGEKLVAIILKSSNIKTLLKGDKCLADLKFIDLSNSQQLIKIPEFSRIPKLEKLNLDSCISFSKLHSSIGTVSQMKFLRVLNFSESGIRELPSSIGSLTYLETLNLSKCSKFEKFPDIFFVNMRHLKMHRLSHSGIKELPTSIECLEALENLLLDNCSNFEKFPEIQKNMENLSYLALENTAIKELSYWTSHLTRLTDLSLRGCKTLRSLPKQHLSIFSEITEDMEHLTYLNLRQLAITELPSSIERLKRLTRLELSNCENLETLPNSIGNLTNVHALLVRNCRKLHKLPDSLRSLLRCLKELDVGGCNLMEGAIPSDLWCLFSLESLNVSENNIRCMPVGIIQLSQLDILRMNHCLMLEEIPELQLSLRWIGAHGCPCLETLSSDPMHLLWSYLLNCFKSQIQDFECPTRSKYYCETRVVIPGSRGIPEWISHKSMGYTNFLGFALFYHHVPLDYDHDLLNPTLDLLMSHGNRFEYMHRIWFSPEGKKCFTNGVSIWPWGFEKDCTSCLDPELMVAYFPQIAISSKYRSNRWNNFKARFYGPYGHGTKVESCGIHLIYNKAQDHPQQSLQLFNVKRSHDDTKDHPHV
ncbi:hypothetical protein PVL29_006505 [Vitis rotundifolia]|uniref:Uncharacterized protein n=1 Tax=Vitis rotundifolia TaxID=103349 RepID=A0AA39A7C6_VITRO|nr:hypothetical protein PVL29_006505 [Vitis rotundifolia]